MRVLLLIVSALFLLFIIGFWVSNPSTTVPINLLNRTYADVFLGSVVFVSVVVGAVLVSIIALFEGAKTRLENRRLQREVHKQETELNYLRTQSSSPVPTELGLSEREPSHADTAGHTMEDEDAFPPDAPVYGADDGRSRRSDDRPDDDTYSGGRAV